MDFIRGRVEVALDEAGGLSVAVSAAGDERHVLQFSPDTPVLWFAPERPATAPGKDDAFGAYRRGFRDGFRDGRSER
jgi:hypothetical protein